MHTQAAPPDAPSTPEYPRYRCVIGQRLRAARLHKGWTQAYLGEHIGLDPSVADVRMNQYERDKHRPSAHLVARMACALDVPVAYFYVQDPVMAKILWMCRRLDPPTLDALHAHLIEWVARRAIEPC